ncbi:MAG: hypothetical protein R6U08_03510 [Bacillota bacterium]
MKKALGLVVAVFFVLAIAAPAFAIGSMDHSATYDFDGDISMKTQIGHLCNTGSETKSVISGEGKMEKIRDVAMVSNKTTVLDNSDWVTAPDAVKNLTVTTVIELCAPPKYEKAATRYVYGEDGDWYTTTKKSVADLGEIYNPYTGGMNPSGSLYNWLVAQGEDEELLVTLSPSEMEELAAELYVDDDLDLGPFTLTSYDKLTKQIWAVQVAADPGYSGNIHQQYEAANGPYQGAQLEEGDALSDLPDEFDGLPNQWGWVTDDDYGVAPAVGDDFVGNYFNIEQMSRTSQGVHKRFIDISSPWSHALLMEDMSVTGFSEIDESFAMNNLPYGEETTALWWELF